MATAKELGTWIVHSIIPFSHCFLTVGCKRWRKYCTKWEIVFHHIVTNGSSVTTTRHYHTTTFILQALSIALKAPWCVASSFAVATFFFFVCRRCAENAFGITAARWRILLRTINVQPSHVDFVVKAACVLHNFLTLYNPHAHQFLDREDSFGNVVGGRWRHGVQHVPDNSFFAMAPTQARNYDGDAGAARRLFASYFSSTAGQVPWQWNLPGLTKKQPS